MARLTSVLLILAISASVTMVTLSQDLVCAPGWTLSGGNCYKLYSEKMEWSDASDVCESYGSHLVSIFGYEENKEVAELVRTQGVNAFWIGELQDDKRGQEGFWSGAEPMDGRDCAYVEYDRKQYYIHAWNKARCNAAMPFLCESNAILAGMFACLNGKFIKQSDVCDGHNGCGDDSDERDCDNLCRRSIKRLEGTIQTENPYGPNQNCMWFLETPVGSRLTLAFSSLRTEELHDEIQVWVGGPTLAKSTLQARLSGTPNINDLKRIYSPNNFMIVVFTSDSSVSMSGFVADYRTEDVLPGAATLLQAQDVPAFIQSPMFGEQVVSSHRITYNIYVPLDRRVISVSVTDFDLPSDAYLEFYDGNNLESPILARIQGGDPSYAQCVISTTNNMTVYYHSGSEDNQALGFRLTYQQGCHCNIQRDFGEALSPGFNAGQNYPNFQECTYKIRSVAPIPIKFIFDSNFCLSGTLGDDTLMVYEGEDDTGSTLVQVTGNAQPNPNTFTANTGKVYIKFKTTSINNACGFKLRFSKNCPAPNFPDSAIVNPTSYTTDLGSKLEVRCPTGYFFAQEKHKDKQLVIMECMPGGWNVDSVPKCERVYCGQPPRVDSAHVKSSEGVQYEHTVTYECDPGFGFRSADTVTCLASAQWTQTPQCIPASCPTQTAPNNGMMELVFGSGSEYGSIVKFSCDNGYEINGDPIIDCRGDGTWSAEKPTCQRLRCTLPVIKNAMNFTNTDPIEFDSTVNVVCEDGYELNGNGLITCQRNQTFDAVPVCNDIVECDTQSICQQSCKNTIGSYECFCSEGYEIAPGTNNCQNIIECDVNNGGCSHTCVDSQGSYSCSCPGGMTLYTAEGTEGFTNDIQQKEDGTRYKDKYYIDHTCVPKKCPDLEILENGSILSSKSMFHYEDEVYFFCELGYKLSAKGPLICQSNGQWNSLQPTCEVATCPFPNTGTYQFVPIFDPPVNQGPLNYGDVLTMTCNEYRPAPLVYTRQCVYDQEQNMYTLDKGLSVECPVIDCGNPAVAIENVPASVITVSPSNTYYLDQFTIACGTQSRQLQPTNNVEGNNTVVCRADGNWDFGTFRCLAKTCNDPGTPPGAEQTATSYSEGQSVSFTCLREGFTLTSSDLLMCALDGETATWNNPVPECRDTTEPVISQAQNLCNGVAQLEPINMLSAPINADSSFTIPTATDNTAASRSLTLTANPPFNPNAILARDFTTTYTARDFDNNIATCEIAIKVKDVTPPTLTCPPSYTIKLESAATQTFIMGDTPEHSATASDNESDQPTIKYTPDQISRSGNDIGDLVEVTVLATDASGNELTCAFTINFEAAPCQDWALASPRNGVKNCQRNSQGNGYDCTMTCNTGHYFYDDPSQAQMQYTCTDGDAFQPTGLVKDCVPGDTADFVLVIDLTYSYQTQPDAGDCEEYYKGVLANKMQAYPFNDGFAICSSLGSGVDKFESAAEVYASKLKLSYNFVAGAVIVSMPWKVLPKTKSDNSLIFGCGTTLTSRLYLGVQAFSQGNLDVIGNANCPKLTPVKETAVKNDGETGRICSPGYKRVQSQITFTSICVPCPYGHYYDPEITDTTSASFCKACPLNQYLDTIPSTQCTACPGEKYTRLVGSTKQDQCEDTCFTVGMKSGNGLAPCQQCPTGSYTIDATTCQSCPTGTTTLGNYGGKSETDCLARCLPGQYSHTGLAICLSCPRGFYQDQSGSRTCKECASNLITDEGADSSNDCKSGISLCTANFCNDHGQCDISQHMPSCICEEGYTGFNCEFMKNFCESSPCYSGMCTPKENGYTCACPPGFSGDRCEIDPDNCASVTCENGGQCQDLLNDFKCLCVANFDGDRCQNTRQVCEKERCANGATCVPIDATRRKCVCQPGFTGRTCETNIDECESNPCLYGGECQDGDNRYSCKCPTGYQGVNCEQRPSVCANPLSTCSNSGQCIDDYVDNYFMCLCNKGYKQNPTKALDEDLWMQPISTVTVEGRCLQEEFCDSDPCEKGNCVYSEDGPECTCPTGFEGQLCQHNVDNCANNPCGVNGRCEDGDNVYRCFCNEGYEGTNCEREKYECVPYPCVSPGTDTSQGSGCRDLLRGYECRCKPGYTGGANGNDCSVDINECASNPCFHGGTCEDRVNAFKCNCVTGWTGARCEIIEEFCTPNPCENGAGCLNTFGKAFCKCEDTRYYGEFCQLESNVCDNPDPCIDDDATCAENDNGEAQCDCRSGGFSGTGCNIAIDFCGQEGICQHGGTCITKLDDYDCECPSDFSGKNCEQSQNNCVNVQCQNGGVCVDGINKHFCQCPIGKTGRNCDKDVDDDFDIVLFSEDNTAVAYTANPFSLGTTSFSIGLWLRFTESGGEGTILTLYGLAERYIGSKMFELLRVDHDKVYVTFGFEQQAFPYKLYDINDGQWYYLNIQWSGAEGSVNVTVNAVRVSNVKSGHGKDWTTPPFAMAVVGAQLETDGSMEPKKGTGANAMVSQVNMWNRLLSFNTEIPSMVDDYEALVLSGLIRRWTDYLVKFGATVTRKSKANSVVCEDPMFTGPACNVPLPDKTPPKIMNCPATLNALGTDRLTQIEWEEIMVQGGLARSTYLNKSVFIWGKYTNVIVAQDAAGNAALCTFDIFVRKTDCPNPIPGPEMNAVCSADTWPFRNCEPSCNPGKGYSVPVPKFYTCGPQGAFNVHDFNLGFQYPACAAVARARVNVIVFLTYEQIPACEEILKVRGLAIPILDYIRELDALWGNTMVETGGFCNGRPCELVVVVTSECSGQNTVGRRRRSTSDAFVRITLQDVREYLFDKNGVKQTPQDILLAAILDDKYFDLSATVPNGFPNEPALRITMSPICGEGQTIAESGLDCVDCAPGTYYDSGTGSCVLCAIGTYQDESKQTSCKSCGSGTTMLTGSTNSADCYDVCDPGTYLDVGSQTCQWCPLGFYQDEPGQFYCKPCPADKTTQSTRSVSLSQCLDFCPDGTELSSAGTCTECIRGTFRTQGVQARCQQCPTGYITESTRSRTEEECTIPDCQAGSYHDVAAKECKMCPLGKYQPQKWQESCTPCPDRKTTMQVGSTLVSQCLFFCPMGLEEYPMGSSVCRPCPLGEYKDNSDPGAACMSCEDAGKPGFVTETTGSISVANCTILACLAGQQPKEPAFPGANPDGCEPCPLGTFQPSPYQPECIACPEGRSTKEEGATVSTACETYCPAGQYHDAFGQCILCEVGTYRNNNGNKFGPCELCDTQFITDGPGATLPGDCKIANCTAGSYHNAGPNVCVACPVGQYQDEDWKPTCKPCPQDKTTEQAGSDMLDDCLLNCEPGYEDAADRADECVECGRGYYKPTSGSTLCTKCRAGYITEGFGATSSGQCTVGDCQPGQRLSTADNRCYPCEKGQYQERQWQTSCDSCPRGSNGIDMTTQDPKDGFGADMRSDCFLLCDSGQEYNKDLDRCVECPRGTYREIFKQDFCELCPPEFTTANTGTVLLALCNVANCTAGTYLNEQENSCMPCPLGEYQPTKWMTQCRPCPFGTTTLTEGGASVEDCVRSCPAGQELILTTKQCRPCPQDKYRNPVESFTCTECPGNTIAPSQGATSANQCTWQDCPAGYYIRNGQCEQCEDGTYQPDKWKTSCLLCAGSPRATTNGEGATSVTQCQSTDDCELDQSLCVGVGEACYDLPGLAQYECRCDGKYVAKNGLTAPCVHKCDTDYCLNNSTCDRNQPVNRMCKCSNDWRGERCDEEPPSMTNYIIGGAVGGFVFLILLALIIAFCCVCLRPSPAPAVTKAPTMMMMNPVPQGSMMARPAPSILYGGFQPTIMSADQQSVPGYSTIGGQQYMFYQDAEDPAPQTQVYGTLNGGYDPYEEKVSAINFS